MHEVRKLLKALKTVEPYPSGVVPVPELIAGTAFFPGGSGIWNPCQARSWPDMPIEGVMVLGHDFHSETAYHKSRQSGSEVKGNATWNNLLKLLDEVGITKEVCFFTNSYMGLRVGSKAMGKFPGASDAGFVDRCRAFFLLQLKAQRPRIVLTLGSWVPAFIAPLSYKLKHWSGVKSFTEIDSSKPWVKNVVFSQTDFYVDVIALTHPCLRSSNVHRRRYKTFVGHEAELKMIKDAMKRTNLTD